MKLQQGQRWKLSDAILRVVKLERLAVEYKSMPVPDPGMGEGTHQRVTKKEFCRMIKSAELLPIA